MGWASLCAILRRRKKIIPRRINPITATPPTTPPAIAPTLVGAEDGGGAGVVGTGDGGGAGVAVVMVGGACGRLVDSLGCPVVAGSEIVPTLSVTPHCSGVSPFRQHRLPGIQYWPLLQCPENVRTPDQNDIASVLARLTSSRTAYVKLRIITRVIPSTHTPVRSAVFLASCSTLISLAGVLTLIEYP